MSKNFRRKFVQYFSLGSLCKRYVSVVMLRGDLRCMWGSLRGLCLRGFCMRYDRIYREREKSLCVISFEALEISLCGG